MNTNRLAVVGEMSSAAAASSLVRPEKKRSFTRRALSGSCASSLSSASSTSNNSSGAVSTATVTSSRLGRASVAERVVGAVVIRDGPEVERIQQAAILDEPRAAIGHHIVRPATFWLLGL